MTLDRCLPQVLLAENKLRHTNHWIILGFFAVCASILTVTAGNVSTLAGVYTLSFLSVMALFALGNMLLKVRRSRLPRDTRAPWSNVMLGFIAVITGLVGNVLLSPEYVRVFGIYALSAGAVVAVMFLRIQILKAFLFVSRSIVDRIMSVNTWIRKAVASKIEDINSRTIVYFTRGDDVADLNRAALYVLDNEQTNRLKVINVYEDESDIPPGLAEHLQQIDKIYPQLRIDFVAVKGKFGPEIIEALSRELHIPKNYMFIGTPGDHFPHRIESLGGVRLIL